MLKDIQKRFLKAFSEKEKQDYFLDVIAGTANFTASERFNVYQSSIIAGRARALRETYPVCEKLVGEDFFLAMAYQFAESFASFSYNLNDYGEHFANFVEKFTPAKNLFYLSDVCRLEWAWQKAYYSEHYVPMDFSYLSEFSEQEQMNIVFRLPPSASLLKSNYPIDQIWQVNQDHYHGDMHVNLYERGALLFVWRKEFAVQIELLDSVQWHILQAIAKKTNLNTLCQLFNEDLSEPLAHMIQRSWLSGFDFET